MPSPFPGMNPYLEQEGGWQEVHHHFIERIVDALVPQARPKYIVRLELSVYLHELSAGERRMIGRPDVYVARPPTQTQGHPSPAPAYGEVPLAVDNEEFSTIEIRDRQNMQVVTVIELLSPANKAPGPDREQYLAKRRRVSL